MRIAITGGGGFIGKAAQRYALEKGHAVTLFDRPEHDILGSLDGLDGAEVVIHLAGVLGTAELFDAAEHAVQTNVIGSLRIMQWCVEHNASYVGITMPPVFESVYTATKICSDRLARAWHKFRGLKTSKVCAYNAFGPGQKHGPGHPQKILPTFATEAWAGRPIPIWGNGEQTVDLVHVDDLGSMLVDATKFGNDELFDGGTGIALTVNQVADFVIEVTGSKAGKQYLPMRAGEVPTHIVATGAGWKQLGWQPALDWHQVAKCVEWYKP